MEQDFCEDTGRGTASLHQTLLFLSKLLAGLDPRIFIIGAWSIVIHGVHLGRETRDRDVAVDKPFTPELRDALTRELRSKGSRVQWSKWGLLVEDYVHDTGQE